MQVHCVIIAMNPNEEPKPIALLLGSENHQKLDYPWYVKYERVFSFS